MFSSVLCLKWSSWLVDPGLMVIVNGSISQCFFAAYTVLRTCNGAEYQVKIFLSMPIYAFNGAILGVFLLVVTLCTVI